MDIEKEKVIDCFNLPEGKYINKYNNYNITDKAVTEQTHIMHKYPSKFIPQIPRWAILEYSNPGDLILDPFSGSGTTAVESLVLNRNAIGIDINPVARLISKTKSTPILPSRLKNAYDELRKKIILDDEIKEEMIPDIPNIDKWFTEKSIKNLSILKYYIYQVEDQDIRDFMLTTFSAIIRLCSNAEYRSQKTYISSRFKREPKEVFEIYDKRFNQYLEGMEQLYKITLEENMQAKIIVGTASDFDIKHKLKQNFGKEFVDLAITSPPYVTAVEYPSVFKLEYQWLDFFSDSEINEHRKDYIGTDRVYAKDYNLLHKMGYEKIDNQLEEIFQTNKKKSHIIYKYLVGMKNNLECVYKVLKQNGKYIIVIGNNSVLNLEVPLSEYVILIAESLGFELENIFSYVIKDRHLIIPRNGRGGIINKDWVIVLNKK